MKKIILAATSLLALTAFAASAADDSAVTAKPADSSVVTAPVAASTTGLPTDPSAASPSAGSDGMSLPTSVPSTDASKPIDPSKPTDANKQ